MGGECDENGETVKTLLAQWNTICGWTWTEPIATNAERLVEANHVETDEEIEEQNILQQAKKKKNAELSTGDIEETEEESYAREGKISEESGGAVYGEGSAQGAKQRKRDHC